MSVEGYYPIPSEQDADSTRAELESLRSHIEDLITRWPPRAGIHLTADEVHTELVEALETSRQVGIDTFQYR